MLPERISTELLKRIREGKVDLRDQPIPTLAISDTLAEYGRIKIEQKLDNSPLVNTLQHGIRGASFYRFDAELHPLYRRNIASACKGVWIRRALLSQLEEANSILKRYGLQLFVLDGFRSLECQREIRSIIEEHWVKENRQLC